MADIVQLKKFFFDKPAVTSKVDAGKRKALSKFGAFVRQRSRTSIRKRKGTSQPGSPPFSHTDRVRSAIVFAFDPDSESVVIGPHQAGRSGAGAKALEGGGTVRVDGKPVTIRARPFMGPAFRAELPRAAEQLKGMVR